MFSKIQRDFLEKLIRCLKDEFSGEQLALSEKIGCDRSQISRWASKENAPPEYVCRLLLKELGNDSVKKVLGRRIRYLREKIFKISTREFAWIFKLESLSQVEAIENGEAELPRHCFEMLMRDYQVSAEHLDYGEGSLFNGIAHTTENILNHLKNGFKLYIVTPPHGDPDRSRLMCKFVLHLHREDLPQCFVTSGLGSFKSTGGGLISIEDTLRAMGRHDAASPLGASPVLLADKMGWKDLRNSCFYRKQITFGPGCADAECSDKFHEIRKAVWKEFNERQKNNSET